MSRYGKRGRSVLALAAVVVFIHTSAFAEEPSEGPAPKLTLFWLDSDNLFPSGAKAVAREVVRIFGCAGVDVVWKKSDPRVPLVPKKVEKLVLLRQSDSASLGLNPTAMGAVIGQEEFGHVVFVFFPNVIRSLGIALRERMPANPNDMQAIARALGRVAAHEIVHSVCPEMPHAENGLMCARLGQAHLRQPYLELDPASARALRSKLYGILLAAAVSQRPRP